MAKLDPIKPEVLSVKAIPKVDGSLARELNLREDQVSVGIITATSDDALYASLDEGTKAANIEVVYAKSFYAGSGNASGPLSGEVIGIIAAKDPSEIESGLVAIIRYMEEKAWFYSADDDNGTLFFPHVIPSVGHYLSRQAKVEPGTSIAYLIAPPIEAMYGMDAALKAANVNLRRFFAPPSETNFAGGLLSGDLDGCIAAANAFQETVLFVASNPLEKYGNLDNLKFHTPEGKKCGGGNLSTRYIIDSTGLRVHEKPDHFTHLHGKNLVPKNHPRIEFRGMLDDLQSKVIIAQLIAKENKGDSLVSELEEILIFLKKMLRAEYMGEKAPPLELVHLSSDELRLASHDPEKYLGPGVKHSAPSHSQGILAAQLNYLRTQARLLEQCAARAFMNSSSTLARPDILKGLNRLSSALYVLYCRNVADKH